MSLRDDILALDPELIESRNDAEIARQLSIGRVKRIPFEIGNGTILEILGLESGNRLLDVLMSATDFRYVRPLLEQGRLEVSSALVRATLDGLAGMQVITADEAAALKAVAETPDPVSVAQVSEILNAEGEVQQVSKTLNALKEIRHG